jgi:hypothetical protein
MQSNHFTILKEQSLLSTLLGVNTAIWSVVGVSTSASHDDGIFVSVSEKLRSENQIDQPSLPAEIEAVRLVLAGLSHQATVPQLKGKELFALMGVLMQFTSHTARLRPYSITPFLHTETLYQEVIKQGHTRPLGLSEQLAIALRQTNGDLPEALWRLFITARLYARWSDAIVIADMPAFTRSEIIDRMCNWSRSVAACKPFNSCPDQDASGDVYYCWTHAIAKVIYKALAAKQTPLTWLEALALQNGTRLNRSIANKFAPQIVPSDHTIAAAYGNALGDVLVGFFNHHLPQ